MTWTDGIRLPLRWSFAPEHNPKDGSICWRWQAFEQTGKLAMQSQCSFDTLTECVNDARGHGYGER